MSRPILLFPLPPQTEDRELPYLGRGLDLAAWPRAVEPLG